MKFPAANVITSTVGLIAILCTGCVQLRYSEYTGTDNSSYWRGQWPLGQGTMAETYGASTNSGFGRLMTETGLNAEGVQVYRGWPDRHYQVLGSLSCPDPNAQWNDDFFSAAAKLAKQHKGDAVIIRQGAEWGVSKIAGAREDPMVLSSHQTTALVIRWLTAQEINECTVQLDNLLKKFAANDPTVAANREVADLIRLYLLRSGKPLNQLANDNDFPDIMEKITTATPQTLAGTWIYKSAESFSTAFSGGSDRTDVGFAAVSVDGDNIAIVSDSGHVEINFSGTLSKNRLAGQIGIGGVTAKCDGAATAEKISLSFQSITPDGTVRGNVVFQRRIHQQNHNEKANSNRGSGNSA